MTMYVDVTTLYQLNIFLIATSHVHGKAKKGLEEPILPLNLVKLKQPHQFLH